VCGRRERLFDKDRKNIMRAAQGKRRSDWWLVPCNGTDDFWAICVQLAPYIGVRGNFVWRITRRRGAEPKLRRADSVCRREAHSNAESACKGRGEACATCP
jgi:hypothetical protein